MSADRKQLLLVDSDEKSRRLLELSFKKDGYDVHTVAGVVDALTALHGGPNDLVVTEIDLEDGDGPALLEQIASMESAPPVMVVTASSDAGAKARCLELGAGEVLGKPVKIKDVLRRAAALIKTHEDERIAASNPVQSGDLAETTVVDLVQAFVASGDSGAIRIERGDLRGTMYFENGALIDAESVRDQGIAAVRRMFTWDDGVYTIVTTDGSDQPRRISESTDAVIDAAMAFAADWTDAVGALGSLSAVYTVEYRSFVAQLGKLPEETNALIRTFDGIRTVEEAIAKSDIDDLVAVQLIAPLVEAEVLQLVSTGSSVQAETDSFERLKTNAFKPIVKTAEHEAIAKRRAQEEAERAAREEEARRLAAERERQRAELEQLEAEQAELDAIRQAELEAAEAEAAAVREAAEARAAELRAAAEARAAEMAAREREIAERRVALTGRMQAIEGPASSDVPEEVAAIRDQERAALERERDDEAGTLALGAAAVAGALAAADEPEPEATPAPRLVEDETPDATHTDHAHTGGGATLAMPGASFERKVAAVEPTLPSVTPELGAAEDAFFSGAHEPVYVDDYAFEEGEERDHKPMIIAVIGLVAALALIFGLGSLDGPQRDPVAPSADAPAPTEEPAADEEALAAAEGSAEGSGIDALAEAEARAEAIRNDLTSKSMQLAEGIAYVAEEVAEQSTQTPVAALTPRATAPAAAATPRAARTENPERPAPTPANDAADGDAESALRACANAYNAGNYATTLESCQTAARLNPRSSDVYTYLGTANYELGNDGQAQNQLERAVQLNRRNITALVTLGAVRQSAGDLDGAREAYETYLQVNPNGRQAPEIRRILEQGL